MKNFRCASFTLIELLIVVAIIGILAAIAVPNFLNAMIRSKVSRVKADLHTLSVAMESYMVDYGRPPISWIEGLVLGCWADPIHFGDLHGAGYYALTTPVAYLVTIPYSPFHPMVNAERTVFINYKHYVWESFVSNITYDSDYIKARLLNYTYYFSSAGPTRSDPPLELSGQALLARQLSGHVYESSNGLISQGALTRTNKGLYTGPGT